MISSDGALILNNDYSSLPYFYYTLSSSIISDTYNITTTVRNQINEIINSTEPNKSKHYCNNGIYSCMHTHTLDITYPFLPSFFHISSYK